MSQWEALYLHTVYKAVFILLQVMQASVSVLQVMYAGSECAVKSKVH